MANRRIGVARRAAARPLHRGPHPDRRLPRAPGRGSATGAISSARPARPGLATSTTQPSTTVGSASAGAIGAATALGAQLGRRQPQRQTGQQHQRQGHTPRPAPSRLRRQPGRRGASGRQQPAATAAARPAGRNRSPRPPPNATGAHSRQRSAWAATSSRSHARSRADRLGFARVGACKGGPLRTPRSMTSILPRPSSPVSPPRPPAPCT